MSTLKVNKLRDTAGSADAITLDPNGGAVLAGVTTMTTARVTSGIVTNTFIVGAGVTISESGIEATGVGITCANINGGQLAGRRNLIINGAMMVAQRGTSSTSTGYQTVDRFKGEFSGTDEACTVAQVDLSSSDTPYTLGFRKAYKITNGNQTSGAGAADYVGVEQRIEAQNVVNSGWNYTSPSSFVTFSFWVKSSVAQNFYGFLFTEDGAERIYSFETGSLTADTWTKITKTIPGNSIVQINNDNGFGLQIYLWAFQGTNYTASGSTLNQWKVWDGADRFPDMTTTWYTTNDATLETTGWQLEVGTQATPFEHRSFDEELESCFRYCQVFDSVDGEYNRFAYANAASGSSIRVIFPLMREMRAKPSVAFSGNFQCPGVGSFDINNVIMETNTGSRKVACLQHGSVSVTSYQTYQFNANGDTSATVTYSAEI